MKKFIALAGCFMLSAAHAEVFKCQKPSGGVEYQSTPCATGPSEQVEIKPTDPEKIKAAQEKLAESLKQQAEREAAAAEAERQERGVAAQEAIAAGMGTQTNAINRNTQALVNTPSVQPVVPLYVGPMAPPPPPMPRQQQPENGNTQQVQQMQQQLQEQLQPEQQPPQR